MTVLTDILDRLTKIQQEMRDRKINHNRSHSPTLIAWADRITAELTRLRTLLDGCAGEVVAWECRVILKDGFGDWHKCSREQYDSIRLTGHYNGPCGAPCEARQLYTHPPAVVVDVDKVAPLLCKHLRENTEEEVWVDTAAMRAALTAALRQEPK